MNIESPESALLNAFIANFNSLILLHLPPCIQFIHTKWLRYLVATHVNLVIQDF